MSVQVVEVEDTFHDDLKLDVVKPPLFNKFYITLKMGLFKNACRPTKTDLTTLMNVS